MQMPEMDGLMLAREIKADESIAGTRLLMMTSLGPRDDDLLSEAGIEVCLRKPVKQSQLYDGLATITSSGSHETQLAHAATPGITVGEDEPGCRPGFANVRVLVAEDNVVNQRVALRQLQNLGYSADGVANGLEVLEALDRIHYNVVLMDCQMPEMDGFEATAEIRRREGTSRHTTIIAMTANALEGEREHCVAAGMDDYISKPVRPEAMSAIIERWTAGSNRPDAPATHTGAERATIDIDVISNLRRLQSPSEPNLLADLIDSFLRDSAERIAEMRSAATQGDAEMLARTAHALKGGSGTLGANRMTALCGIVEELGRTGSAGGAPVLIAALEEEFERVRRALQAEKSIAAERSL